MCKIYSTILLDLLLSLLDLYLFARLRVQRSRRRLQLRYHLARYHVYARLRLCQAVLLDTDPLVYGVAAGVCWCVAVLAVYTAR